MPKLVMLFLIFYLVVLISAAPEKKVLSEDESLELFEEFMKEHTKQYDPKEKEERFKIFSENLKEINYRNEKSSHATFGITYFADLTNEEFIQRHTGYKPEVNSLWKELKKTKVSELFNYTVPDEFDWRSKGVVSRVKDQAHCGSCWAFSVTGNVESLNAIKSGKIVEISEQQLVDCDNGSGGCGGGDPSSALSYLVANGAMSSQSYPYEAKNGVCRYKRSDVVIKLKNAENVALSEEDIKKKLYTTGPLSIAIAANALRFYHKGILVNHCNDDKQVNHAVLLVGYGQENGVPYWLIKNSWSSKWGDKGYFRIKRGVNCLDLTLAGIFTGVI